MTQIATIDISDVTITPFFELKELENIAKSETAGFPVMEMHEIVQVRFAGQSKYSPVFPTDAFYRREGNRVITYAERWPDQYRAWKEGNPQEARGTPLEMLRQHGITPEQISLCRALKIYSIEALHHLGANESKSLGMHVNSLKAAAAKWMADREASRGAFSEIEALKARISELESVSTKVPEAEASSEEIAKLLQVADDAYADKSEADLKDMIENKAGVRPRGNPNRKTLVSMLEGLEAA